MKRSYFLIIVVLFIIACNNQNRTAGWSRTEEDNWLKLCIDQLGNNHPNPKQYCSCVLDKIEKKYPTYAEANRHGTEAEGRQFGMECKDGNTNVNNNDQGDNYKKDDNNNNNRDNSNYEGGWSTSDKDSWVRQCLQSIQDQNFPEQAKRNYCDCVGEKLEQRYSNFSEMNRRGTYEEGKELGSQCASALTGGNDNY